MEILGRTANEIWLQTFNALASDLATKLQPSRAGDTSEILHVQLCLENPRERWVLSRSPGINPAFALAEVIWIMAGREDSQYLNHWNGHLPKYAGKTECYHGAYGNRLRRRFGFDQLERAYMALKSNPESRQVVLEIWNPIVDFPNPTGLPTAPDIPCNTHAYLIVRNGKLEWTQFMRSNDIMLGLPYNLIQFTSLQEIIAGWLGIEIGSYHHYSNSLHLYEVNRCEFNAMPVDVIHSNFDTLSLPKPYSDDIFRLLDHIVDTIVFKDLSEASLQKMIMKAQVPQAYKNWLYIIGAEESRRKSWHVTKNIFISSLTNPVLKQVWDIWHMRFGSALKAQL